MAATYKYYHKFDCGHTQRTDSYDTWQWMRGQLLCKSCNEVKNMRNVAEPVKPQLGLRPAAVWQREAYRQRGIEISQAISRYAEAAQDIPSAWLRELATVNKKLQAGSVDAVLAG